MGAVICRILFFSLLFLPSLLLARSELPASWYRPDPSGVIVQDGSYVMNVGEVHMHLSNNGFVGSAPGALTPFSDAPSFQWPAGSGNEYLFVGGLWVGGVVLGEKLVSTGGGGSEWKPLSDYEYTIYEARNGALLRPEGNYAAGGKRYPGVEMIRRRHIQLKMQSCL